VEVIAEYGSGETNSIVIWNPFPTGLFFQGEERLYDESLAN
jgi:predicted transcriptional regulator